MVQPDRGDLSLYYLHRSMMVLLLTPISVSAFSEGVESQCH